MDELQRIEFEIEKVKAMMMQFERVSNVLQLPKEVIEENQNRMLEKLSNLIKKRNNLRTPR